jgi:hypothetical protein
VQIPELSGSTNLHKSASPRHRDRETLYNCDESSRPRLYPDLFRIIGLSLEERGMEMENRKNQV